MMTIFVYKKRTVPRRLKQLRALHRRVNVNHSAYKKISQDLTLRELGFQGERSLDYHLNFLNDDFMILHDLRLKGIQQTFFQMDTIAVCRSFIAIIEVKHLSGHIYFDEGTRQMLRKINEVVEGLPNPLTQVRRQRIQLVQYLLEQRYPLLPIVPLVVFSNPSTVIETTGLSKLQSTGMIRSEFLPEKLEILQSNYPQTILSETQIHSLVEKITHSDVPDNPNILQEYGVSISELKKGVECPACKHSSMNRTNRIGSWYCVKCQFYSKNAHVQALEDFNLLITETPLTNKSLRDFLQINSRHIMYRLLKNSLTP